MIQKLTLIIPSDKSGVWLAKSIHSYSKLSLHQKINFFGKCSLRECSPLVSALRRKKKKNFLHRTSFVSVRCCGSWIKTPSSFVTLKKRLAPLGRRVVGFTSKQVIRKKALSSFIAIL